MKKVFKTLAITLIIAMLVQIMPMSVIADAIGKTAAGTTAAQEESPIIGEVKGYRDRFTKVYQKEDGTLTAVVSSTPIHFQDNKEWADIDNTLIAATVDGKAVLKNKKNEFNVSLPAGITDDGEAVVVEKDGYSLSFSINDVETSVLRSHIDAETENITVDENISAVQKAVKLENKSSKVKYESIQSDVDMEYTVLPDSVKENIILNRKPKDGKTFSFNISAPGMTAALLNNKNIEFYGKDKETVFTLPAPFMVDANNINSKDIEVQFADNKNGSFTLTYAPSKEWLGDSKRIYPVFIDPIVKLNSDSAVNDTYISDAAAKQNNNYGSDTYATIGNLSDGSYWTYIKPQSPIYAGKAIVTDAKLKVYAKSDTEDMAITASVVTGNWFENSLKYINKPANGTQPIDYAVAPASQYEQITFDITQAISVSPDGNKYGVVLSAYDSTLNSTNIYTSEYASPQYTPVIEYSFVESTGLSDKFEYHTQNAGRAGTVSVNNFTGGMFIERDEIGIDGKIMPVNIKQYFSTASADLMNSINFYLGFSNYGQTWLTNYNRYVGAIEDYYIDETGTGIDVFFYLDETGDITYFEKTETVENGLEKWAEQFDITSTGKGLTLWVPDSYYQTGMFEGILIEKESGEELLFDEWGRLTEITSAPIENVTADPPTIQIHHEEDTLLNEIDYIIDGVGRRYEFTYNTESCLTSIQAFDSQDNAITVGSGSPAANLAMTYTYDNYNRLIGAVYPDGESVTYTYASSPGLPLIVGSVTDINGYRLSYEYNSAYAVTQITEEALNSSSTYVEGNVVDITYDSPYQRTFEESYGNSETVQFDKYGRKIAVYDNEGNYYRYTYEDTNIDGKTYNLLSNSSPVEDQNENILNNGGFENGSTGWTLATGASIDNTVSYTGSSSHKFTCATRYNCYSYQSAYNLTPGKYTFSIYLKVPTQLVAEDWGAKIRMRTKDASGTMVDQADSDFIEYTGENWQRLNVSLNVTESSPTITVYIFLYNSISTVYFDDAKLERTDNANGYNILSNSTMESVSNNLPRNWAGSELETNDIATTASKFGETVNVMKIAGNPSKEKSISQTFNVNGGTGDTISIGCWVKAQAASNGGSSTFRLRLVYTITSTQQTETETLNIVPYTGHWQFVDVSFTLKGACTSAAIYLDYGNQINEAYFTDVRAVYTDVESEPDESEPDQDNLLLDPGFELLNGDWTLPNEASIDSDVVLTGTHSNKIISASAGNYYSSQSLANLVPSKYTFSFYVYIPDAISAADAGAKIQAITKDANGTAVDTINSGYVKNTNGDWQELNLTVETTTQAPNLELRVCLYNTASTVYFDDGRLEYLRSEYTYDSLGNVLSTTVNNTEKTMVTDNTYTTDKNYLASTTNSAGNVISYNYNTNNGTLTSVTDGRNNAVSYTYNAMRTLAGVTQAVTGLSTGSSISNSYSYADDRLDSIETGNGVEYTFDYDLWGNLAGVNVGTQSLADYTYGTNANRSRLASMTYGNGQTMTLSYDSDNNITGISYEGGTTWRYTYAYSDEGRLVSITDNASGQITTYTDDGYEIYTNPQGGQGVLLYSSSYDQDDHFVQTANGYTYTYADSEDDYDRDTGATVSGSTVSSSGTSLSLSSTTDLFGRKTDSSVTVKDGTNNLGSVAADVTYQNGTGNRTTEFAGSYKNIVTPTTGSAVNVEYTYTYDNNGNITTESLGGVLKYTYYYDEANQLTRVNDAVQNKTFVYVYDNGGNITSKIRYAYTTGTLGTAEQTTSFAYGDNNWKDKLTSYGSAPLTYDAIGNLTSFAGDTYTWTAGRQLAKFEGPNDYSIEYTYNADGLRTRKFIDDPENWYSVTYDYIWADGKLISQTDGTNILYFIYDENGSPIAFTVNDTDTYLYIKNLQGDITGIVNENGAVIANYVYDAWGKLVSVTGSSIGTLNPLRYRGYYYDSETAYYYLQSRYYSPVLGRFLNADGQINVGLLGTNLFAYCYSDPVNMVDYDGNDPVSPWASRLCNGNGTYSDILYAFYIYNNNLQGQWVGFAASYINIAINVALKSKATKLSSKGLNFIKSKESFRANKYLLPGEKFYTIGYGHQMSDGKNYVIIDGKQYTSLTEPLAAKLLMQDINNTFVPKFNKFLTNNRIALTQQQYDACIADCFQKGQNIWGNSNYPISNYILTRNFSNYNACLSAFLGSSSSGGLLNRRTSEAKMFFYGIY